MLCFIFFFEYILTSTTVKQFDHHSMVTMNGFTPISEHELIWGVFALDAEKNWFKTNTFHLTVCSKMKMKFCREIPETFQLRREWRNVNKNEETRSYSFALFNLTLSIKITKGGLDIDHSHSYSFSYINSYIFPLSIIRITLTCYSKMNQEAFIRSLIPRVCCDGISICQGKLITEIMGKKHQPFFRLFFIWIKTNYFFAFFLKKDEYESNLGVPFALTYDHAVRYLERMQSLIILGVRCFAPFECNPHCCRMLWAECFIEREYQRY